MIWPTASTRLVMGKKKHKSGATGSIIGSSAAASSGMAAATKITVRPVTDPGVLNQSRVFSEALRQTTPLAAPGSIEIPQIARTLADGTALRRGILPETCQRLITIGRPIESLFSGAHPIGKAAEIVAISDYRALHAGKNPGITNPPRRVARNVADIRLSPHHASRKDLLFTFRTKDGMLVFKSNGQVKTGSSRYVADSLVKMANTRGYGKVGYVDARLVNADGAPRVAPYAFTDNEARRLREAKVRLRGLANLESRGVELLENVRKYGLDGLDPAQRQQIQQFRDDIAKAYQPGRLATQLAMGTAIAAATAAITVLVFQAASGEPIDGAAVGSAAGQGAMFGAGAIAADAGIFHTGSYFGLSPEVARSVAHNSVAAGFFLLAVGADIFSEVKSARDGYITKTNATAGIAAKIALNLLPFVIAPFGFAGIPLLMVAQLGGRWAIARVREADRKLEHTIEQDRLESALLRVAIDQVYNENRETVRECDETDAIYHATMSRARERFPHIATLQH
jgi:hypothetical protein